MERALELRISEVVPSEWFHPHCQELEFRVLQDGPWGELTLTQASPSHSYRLHLPSWTLFQMRAVMRTLWEWSTMPVLGL